VTYGDLTVEKIPHNKEAAAAEVVGSNPTTRSIIINLVITELNLGSYGLEVWNYINPALTSLLAIATSIIGFIGGRKSINLFHKKSRKNNDEDKNKFD
jgi:hypothetical protein